MVPFDTARTVMRYKPLSVWNISPVAQDPNKVTRAARHITGTATDSVKFFCSALRDSARGAGMQKSEINVNY
jgi:hypothetical protein